MMQGLSMSDAENWRFMVLRKLPEVTDMSLQNSDGSFGHSYDNAWLEHATFKQNTPLEEILAGLQVAAVTLSPVDVILVKVMYQARKGQD